MTTYWASLKWQDKNEHEKKKRGRPKWSKAKRDYTFTFDWALRGMKSWQRLYMQKPDNWVSGRITTLWLSGTFKTERVIVVHLHTHETEEWVMITKI